MPGTPSRKTTGWLVDSFVGADIKSLNLRTSEVGCPTRRRNVRPSSPGPRLVVTSRVCYCLSAPSLTKRWNGGDSCWGKKDLGLWTEVSEVLYQDRRRRGYSTRKRFIGPTLSEDLRTFEDKARYAFPHTRVRTCVCVCVSRSSVCRND